MKKSNLLILSVFLLIGCDTTNSSLTTSSPSNDDGTITVTLKEMMAEYKQKGNYTYTVDDELFDVVTTFRYTKNAFYYEPNKAEHGGYAYGYAENSKGVFEYSINENKQIEYGKYITDNDGNYVKNMWLTIIPAFIDIVVDLLPDVPVEGEENLYKIEDANNKLLISSLAGYGDVVVQSYIDVYIELLSNTTFRTIVHTVGLGAEDPKWVGYIYGNISNVGTTTIPEIEKELKDDNGPEMEFTAILEFLRNLKKSQNYTVTTTGSKNYVDRYMERYYYSKNNDDDSLSKGYACSEEGVYSYHLNGSKVEPNEVIGNGNGETFPIFWNTLPGFYSFSSMNLSYFDAEKISDKTFKIEKANIMMTFADVIHVGSTSVNQNTTLEVTLTDNGLSFVMNFDNNITVNGVISNVESTTIPEIQNYTDGPLKYPSIDDICRNFVYNLSNSKNYTLSIVSTVTSNSLKPFNLTKKYTNKAYYQSYENSSNNYGYIELSDAVYKFTYNEGIAVKGENQNAGYYLWSSNLFKSFKNIDSAVMQGKKLADNKYVITDNTTKNAIYTLAGFSIYDLMFGVKQVVLEISNPQTLEGKITVEMSSGETVTITIKDVGTTSIDGLENLN